MSDPRTLVGHGVSPGIAIGKPVIVENRPLPVMRVPLSAGQIEPEVARLRAAAKRAAKHLFGLAKDAASTVGAEYASIFEAHRLMLEDPALLDEVERLIRGEAVNAEWALEQVTHKLLAKFQQLGDVYLRERQTDVLDVAAQLQRSLQGREGPTLGHGGELGILVADDIPPSQAIQLASRGVSGFTSETGGITSHTTIIAKSLGIPAVVGVAGLVEAVGKARLVIVDGFEGHILVDPDPALIQVYSLRAEEHRRRQQEMLGLAHLPAKTLDGHAVTLLANIDLVHEIAAAKAGGAEGIGLFRSEFLFLQASPALPDEEEQEAAYAALIDAFPEGPVTIRTFDLGADKQVDGGRAGAVITVNPALGLRAVRLCLHDTSLFRPQLRAILRASVHGDVRMMIPMLSSQDEIFRVLDLLEETKSELKRSRVKFNPKIRVGGMIEVPAAAICADLFAPYLDFFSIGTNDLIQYTLAIDRVDDAVNYLYDPLHPSVLRLIDLTIQAGKKARIPVAMCGEMAGDPRYTSLLLGLGLTEFSMHPVTLLEVKKIVRDSSVGELTRFAKRVLKIHDIREVHAAVEKLSGR